MRDDGGGVGSASSSEKRSKRLLHEEQQQRYVLEVSKLFCVVREEPTKTNVVDGFVFLFFFCSFFDDVAVFENGHSGGNMPIRSL